MRGLMPTIEGRSLGCYRALGLGGFARVLASKLGLSQRPGPFCVVPSGYPHPVYLRAGTSDVATFFQVFHDLEYELDEPSPVRNIIDAGANIGLSAIFFAWRYPSATVIAMEPEASNFEVLQKNAAPYPRIVPLQSALWSSNATLDVTDPGQGKWGYQVVERANARQAVVQRVNALTVDAVMERAGFDHVDILKLDIEGAEKEVLDASSGWIDKVGLIAAELHDRFKPGCSRSFYNATNGFDMEWRRGEHVFVCRRTSGTAVETAATCTMAAKG
jgi:FkbM family methyltransferase